MSYDRRLDDSVGDDFEGDGGTMLSDRTVVRTCGGKVLVWREQHGEAGRERGTIDNYKLPWHPGA